MIELVRQLWSLFGSRQRRQAFGLFFLMLVGAAFEAIGIGLIMPFIALVADPSAIQDMPLLPDLLAALGISAPQHIVIAAGLGLLGVYLLKNLYLALMYHTQFRFIFANQVRISRRLFRAYLLSPYPFHLRRNSAQLLRNVTEEVRMTFINVMLPLFRIAVELLVVFVIAALLIAVEPLVAPIALVSFALISLAFYRAVRAKTTRLGQLQQHHNGLMIQWVNQGLGGLKEAKVAGCEDYFLQRYDHSSQAYARSVRYHRFIKEMPRNVIETVGLGGMILVVVLLVARGQPMGQILPVLGLFAMAAVRLMPSLTRIISSLTGIRHFTPSIDVISRDLQALDRGELPLSLPSPDSDDGLDTDPLPFEDSLCFEGVSFSYPDSATPAIQDLDLRIEPGESVGLVGTSGAGKTTLVDLLLGLLPPTHGSITVDNRPIDQHLRRWRSQLGYIAQPTYLMDDTIRRNIAFGVDDDQVDDGQVWQALEQAQLASLIRSLPDQLDTPIGEAGVRLSGGQRQRLGIARALYREPRLLVLDEATSALDTPTEREISDAIDRLAGDLTLVIIAHRLSTVRHCDRLLLLDEGRLVDAGTYDELLARNDHFQNMVRAAQRPRGPGSNEPAMRYK